MNQYVKETSEQMQARLWASVKIAGPDDCWEWIGARNERGYGIININGRRERAHRAAYEFKNKIPNGLTLDHLCKNKSCVNPRHMEAVTGGENARRFMLGRTHCKRGHEYNESNTRIGSLGERVCRVCARENQRGYHAVDQANKRKYKTLMQNHEQELAQLRTRAETAERELAEARELLGQTATALRWHEREHYNGSFSETSECAKRYLDAIAARNASTEGSK